MELLLEQRLGRSQSKTAVNQSSSWKRRRRPGLVLAPAREKVGDVSAHFFEPMAHLQTSENPASTQCSFSAQPFSALWPERNSSTPIFRPTPNGAFISRKRYYLSANARAYFFATSPTSSIRKSNFPSSGPPLKRIASTSLPSESPKVAKGKL